MNKTLPDADVVRTRRDGAESRRELLAAARRLFAEHGYHGASVGDIARSAGLRKPSLFHHFTSKDVVYATVMEEVFSEFGTAISAAAQTRGTYAARLDAMNDAIVDFLVEHPEAARLLFREAIEPVAGMEKKGVTGAISVLALAEQFLLAGMKAREFVVQDAKQLLLSLTGLHLTYFAIAPVAGPYLGGDVTTPDLAKARKEAVREQARRLVVAPAKAK